LFLAENQRYFKYLSFLRNKLYLDIFWWIEFSKKVLQIISPLINNFEYSLAFGRFISRLQSYIHYLILFFTLFYDILLNHGIVTNIFLLLPFVFVYDLRVKFCKFDEGLNGTADQVIHHWLYSPCVVIDETYIQMGP
jgi:hypothetical protein